MITEFLKEQNISLTNIWVCQDTKGNVRTVDLEKLLEDYYKWKVKSLNGLAVKRSEDCPNCQGEMEVCSYNFACPKCHTILRNVGHS